MIKSSNGKLPSSNTALNNISDAFQQDHDLKRIQGRYSPWSILLITIVGIALAEVVAMIVVYGFRQLPYYQQVLIDATIMTVIIFPILYFLSFRPILQHIQQRYQVEQVLKARLRIIQYATTHSLDEILQFTLDELETLTGSAAGYFHFIENDQKTIILQTWSTNTLQNVCRMNGVERHYAVDDAGVWADCIRLRKVVVHNDYTSLPDRKGLPEGHAPIVREMAVPIMRDEKIVAVLGVGNKPGAYTTGDIELVSTLADFTWDIVKHKRADDALRESEEKFRTLVDWTYDWELWLAPEGKIIYTSPSCERITGYAPDEFVTNPDLLVQLVHPEDQIDYEGHHQLVHDEAADIMTVEYRLITRDGSERWIEHVCRPLFGAENRYLGRRISNRDITERKQVEKEIEERNQKEKMLMQTIHTMQIDIARDLHDTIGQNVGFLRMRLDYLSEKSPQTQTEMNAEIKNMSKVANESYDLIRGTLALLHSENSADLLSLFRRYANQVSERSTFEIDFTSYGEPKPLSANQMRQLFYIFREALSNIEKYADASQASVEITWDEDKLVFVIYDNGQGFDPARALDGSHYGLKFMQERASQLNGALRVYSAAGSGTNIVVHAPYEKGLPILFENKDQLVGESK
ncbi:MAG: GAF domain-containing protein [Chloroflexota bacterium]